MVIDGNLEECAGYISLSFNRLRASALGQELGLTSQPRCVSGTFPMEGRGIIQRHGLGQGGRLDEKKTGPSDSDATLRVCLLSPLRWALRFSFSDTETRAKTRPVSVRACALNIDWLG